MQQKVECFEFWNNLLQKNFMKANKKGSFDERTLFLFWNIVFDVSTVK